MTDISTSPPATTAVVHYVGPTPCSKRCGHVLCGSTVRRVFTCSVFTILVVSITLLVVGGLQTTESCEAGCEERPCTGQTLRVFDCTCPGQCRMRTQNYSPTFYVGLYGFLAVGLVLSIMGCVACCNCENAPIVVTSREMIAVSIVQPPSIPAVAVVQREGSY